MNYKNSQFKCVPKKRLDPGLKLSNEVVIFMY